MDRDEEHFDLLGRWTAIRISGLAIHSISRGGFLATSEHLGRQPTEFDSRGAGWEGCQNQSSPHQESGGRGFHHPLHAHGDFDIPPESGGVEALRRRER
jgi:hypothetical protein